MDGQGSCEARGGIELVRDGETTANDFAGARTVMAAGKENGGELGGDIYRAPIAVEARGQRHASDRDRHVDAALSIARAIPKSGSGGG